MFFNLQQLLLKEHEFLDEEEEVKDVENPISTKDIVGEVEFNHVHFSYNPEKIINDFTQG